MFSPEPRGSTVRLWAEIEHADGSRSRFEIDESVVGGDLRFHRWNTWMEAVILDGDQQQLEALAAYLTHSDESIAAITFFGEEEYAPHPEEPKTVVTRRLLVTRGSADVP